MKQLNPIDVHVGRRVWQRRKMLGVTQAQIGEALGVSFQQVQKYEKGIDRISASRLQHIARELTVPVSFFFEDAPGAEIADAGDASTRLVAEFLSTLDGIALNRAFMQIRDPKLRRKVLEMVKELAGDEDDEADL